MAGSYGAPEEVAEIYGETEVTVNRALRTRRADTSPVLRAAATSAMTPSTPAPPDRTAPVHPTSPTARYRPASLRRPAAPPSLPRSHFAPPPCRLPSRPNTSLPIPH